MKNENLANKDLYYKTKDLYVASLLFCLGVKLQKAEKTDGILFFYFNDKEDCDDVMSDFYNRKIKIEPLKFIESIKIAKGFIYNY